MPLHLQDFREEQSCGSRSEAERATPLPTLTLGGLDCSRKPDRICRTKRATVRTMGPLNISERQPALCSASLWSPRAEQRAGRTPQVSGNSCDSAGEGREPFCSRESRDGLEVVPIPRLLDFSRSETRRRLTATCFLTRVPPRPSPGQSPPQRHLHLLPRGLPLAVCLNSDRGPWVLW